MNEFSYILFIAFSSIFAQLEINSTVTMSKIVVQISPYDPVHDQMTVLGDNYAYNLLTSMTSDGTFTITTHRIDYMTLDDWNRIINFPAYQLNLNVTLSFLFRSLQVLI